MKATDTEIKIINALLNCSFQPGSFDKKLPKQIDIENVSPLQKYYIYFLGYKYRKQIGNDILKTICENYLSCNSKPLSRKDSTKILKLTAKLTNLP